MNYSYTTIVILSEVKSVNKLSTGEIAERLGVTPHTIRNWHKSGKLVPEYVDPETNHRYYTEGYPAEFYGDSFHQMVIDLHRKYDNLNILLERAEGQHNEEERFQDMKQSLEIDALCKNVLEKYFLGREASF